MIQVSNLSFSYAKQPFISDMSFSVSSGEIFGFLVPSGAGKSTLQKILIGLLNIYQGSVMVNSIECMEHTKRFYEDIGKSKNYTTSRVVKAVFYHTLLLVGVHLYSGFI